MLTQKQCAYTLAGALMWVMIYSVIPATHALPGEEDQAIALARRYSCAIATSRVMLGVTPERLAKYRWPALTVVDFYREWVTQRMAARGITDHKAIRTEYRVLVPEDRRLAALSGRKTIEIVTSFPASPTYPANRVSWLVSVNLEQPTEERALIASMEFHLVIREVRKNSGSIDFLYSGALQKHEPFYSWCAEKQLEELRPPAGGLPAGPALHPSPVRGA